MRVMALNTICKNKYTCIHIRNILMQKGNSKPILTARLDAIFNNRNTLCFVENISKHLMRIESLFYQELNGQRYLGLTDLVERWINFKYMDITMTNKFSMEIFEYIIVDYNKNGLQLLCMFTIFPCQVYDSREDRTFLNVVGNPNRPPSCFSEQR